LSRKKNLRMDENGFAGPGTLRIARPIQTGLKTTIPGNKRKPFRRKQVKPPPVAPHSPPTHRYTMAAVAARAGAARAGFRRMFAVSAFSPPPAPASRPTAEPCNNLFVSGNSSSRVYPFYSVSSFVFWIRGLCRTADINYLWSDVWKVITCFIESRLPLYFIFLRAWVNWNIDLC
jgi:hypothetical protein